MSTTLLTLPENGQKTVSCGCSKCPAPLPHAWTLSTFRKNWTAGCSSVRPERLASARCVENCTLSALVSLSFSPGGQAMSHSTSRFLRHCKVFAYMRVCTCLNLQVNTIKIVIFLLLCSHVCSCKCFIKYICTCSL